MTAPLIEIPKDYVPSVASEVPGAPRCAGRASFCILPVVGWEVHRLELDTDAPLGSLEFDVIRVGREDLIEKPAAHPFAFGTPFPRIWPSVGLRVDLLNHHPSRVRVTLRAIGAPLQNILPSAPPRGARGGFEFL